MTKAPPGLSAKDRHRLLGVILAQCISTPTNTSDYQQSPGQVDFYPIWQYVFIFLE